MTTLHFVVLKSRQTTKKTYIVYLAVTHKRIVRYIPTEYEIDDLFQFDKGVIVCRKDAKTMNQRLAYVLSDYQVRLNSIEDLPALNCLQVKELLERKHKIEQCTSLIDCMNTRINNLRKEGRDSYASMNEHTLEKIKSVLGDITLKSINTQTIDKFVKGMNGLSNATKQMRLSHLKACLNEAIREGLVKYDVHPFVYTKMPKSPSRQVDLTIEEFCKIKNFKAKYKKHTLAKDIFLLSFYLGGMNLADLVRVDFSQDSISFERKKTSNKKQGEKKTILSIPEPAKIIIKKYIQRNGKLDFGYKFTYSNFQRYLDRCLKSMKSELGIKSSICYYSARKTFSQFAFDLGIRTEIVEYCIGQSMKENRPIYNYVRVMKRQADAAIQMVIDYTENPDEHKLNIVAY